MAQKKVTDLPLLAGADTGDYYMIVDTSASTTKKVAAENVLPNASVATAKIADDAVTAAKIDWASTGANAGIWWEELGRTTLGTAGDTITVSSLSARRYLKILISLQDTAGTIDARIRFNNDTAGNYALRQSGNGGADATAAGTTYVGISTATAAYPNFFTIEVVNLTSKEKIGYAHGLEQATAGSGTAPSKSELTFKWSNTSAQINSVTVFNGGTGDYAIGSEVVVLGHN